MGEQLNANRQVLSAARLALAALLLLRLGGIGAGLIPSGAILLPLLALLIAYERVSAAFAAHGRAATMARWRTWTYQHRFVLGITAITIFALALRLWGINRDLGHIALGIDENRLNASVLHLFQTGEIEYRTVEHYPGIHYWMLVGTYLLAYIRGLMTDVAGHLDAMSTLHFVAYGRILSALLSSATVALTGLLGRRLAGVRAGLLAAGIMALAPLSVSLGRQLRHDATATLLLVGAVYVALGVYERAARDGQALLAGALAGLAAGVKYTAVFVLLPVLLAAATAKDRSRRARATGLALCGFLAAALLSNHFVWADIPNLLNQLAGQIMITGEGHWAAQQNPAFYHVQILAQRVVGWPLLLLAAATLASRLAAGSWRWWLFSTYPLVALWFVSQRPSQLPRWVYPEAPFAAAAAGAGLVALVGLVGDRLPAGIVAQPRSRRLAVILLVLVFLAPLLYGTALSASRQASPPTWTLTEQWLADNGSQGDRVLLQRQWLRLTGLRLALNRQRLDEVFAGGFWELAANDWIVVHEALLGHPALNNLELATQVTVDPSWFGNQGPDFAVYRPPRLSPAEVPLTVSLDDGTADRYLGHEWPPRRRRQTGRTLPAAGAELYLPPLGGQERRLDVLVDGQTATGLAISSGQQDLEVTGGEPAPDGAGVLTVELPLSVVGPGVVRLRLRPVEGSGPVRVLGWRLY